MNLRQLHARAARGEAEAAAAIVELALRPRHTVCQGLRAGSTLHLTVASLRPLPKRSVVRALKNGFLRLSPAGVQFVHIKVTGATAARVVWEERIVMPVGGPALRGSQAQRRGRFTVPLYAAAAAALVLLALAGAMRLVHPPPSADIQAPVLARAEPAPQAPLKKPNTSKPPRPKPAPPATLIAGPPPPPAAQQPEPVAIPVPPPPAPPVRLRIKAVGDILPGTDFPTPRLFAAQEAAVLETIQGLTRDADLVFGNLETTLTRHPRPRKGRHSPHLFSFRTPPRYAAWLKQAGFDLLGVANNHTLDFGPKGFADTLAHLSAAGIQAVGQPGEITYTRVRGRTIAFLGFSYSSGSNSMRNLEAARALVREAEAAADWVAVSLHAGAEGAGAQHLRTGQEYYLGEARGDPVGFSRALIDQGADLILGHGPHVPRAMELYRGRLIAYSLGNFIGYGGLSARGPNGVSLVLEADLGENGAFLAGRIIPIRLTSLGLPYPDPQHQSVRAIRRLTFADIAAPGLLIESGGRIDAMQSLAEAEPAVATADEG